MGNVHKAGAGGHGRANHAVDREHIPGDGRANDIGDRVDGADFVKVNFFDTRAVHFSFGLGDFLKDAQCQLALGSGERAAFDQFDDVVQVAVGMLGLVFDCELQSTETALFGFFGF